MAGAMTTCNNHQKRSENVGSGWVNKTLFSNEIPSRIGIFRFSHSGGLFAEGADRTRY